MHVCFLLLHCLCWHITTTINQLNRMKLTAGCELRCLCASLCLCMIQTGTHPWKYCSRALYSGQKLHRAPLTGLLWSYADSCWSKIAYVHCIQFFLDSCFNLSSYLLGHSVPEYHFCSRALLDNALLPVRSRWERSRVAPRPFPQGHPNH